MNDEVVRYGGHDIAPLLLSDQNFAGAAFNSLSFGCTPIELLSNDGNDEILGTATGFFWKKNGQSYLITNWHAVSGRHAFTGAILHDKGYIPQRISFYGLSVSVESGVINFERRRHIFRWEDDMIERLSKPPQFDGQPLDIWAAPIPSDLVFGRDPARTGFEGAADATCYVNENTTRRIVTNVGDDCFILGYPLRNYEGLMPPIWKRGSIASEATIGVGGRPMFLVDAATTRGMSGSPIIRKMTTLTADNRDIGALQEFSSYELIGVYAGRLNNTELEKVNLGYGWHKATIDRALDHYRWFQPSGLDSGSGNIVYFSKN